MVLSERDLTELKTMMGGRRFPREWHWTVGDLREGWIVGLEHRSNPAPEAEVAGGNISVQHEETFTLPNGPRVALGKNRRHRVVGLAVIQGSRKNAR